LTPPHRQPRIFVTVGTHEQGFPRLISAVAAITTEWLEHDRPAEWIVQTGPVTVSLPPNVRHFPSCSHVEIQKHLSWADISLSQSAPGSVFAAIAQGSMPIVVPRSKTLGEHVDNHQYAFADYLAKAGVAMVVTDTAQLGETLLTAISEPYKVRMARLTQLEVASRHRTAYWSRQVGKEIEALHARRTS
jgi:UDP-N-acetylglucosamine transferase subunit ALG13